MKLEQILHIPIIIFFLSFGGVFLFNFDFEISALSFSSSFLFLGLGMIYLMFDSEREVKKNDL